MKLNTLCLLIILAVCCGNLSFSQRTKEVRKTVDLNANGRVSIKTYKGSITIDTWEKPRVEIVATVEPDGHHRDDEELVRETEIRIDESPDEVRIESDYDRLEHHRRHSFWGFFVGENITLPFVHYTITMPRTARVAIDDYKSESHITDLHAPLKLETYKGTVSVDGLAGSIDLETYKGEVTVTLAKLDSDSRLKTEKGKFDINFAPEAGCTIDLDIGRRADYHSDFDTARLNRRHGEDRMTTTINGGGPSLRIETKKGEIRLRKK